MFQRVMLVLAAIGVLFVTPLSVLGSGPNWEPVEDDDGIKVWSLQIPGQDLPGFRGITVINEWMYRCRDARLLKQYTESHGILYNRVRAPWPIKDRDMVLDVDYRFTPQHNALTIRFKNTHESEVPVPFWTVRIPRIEGFYRLWTEESGKTNVLYQVPDFSARRYAKKLPFVTLQKLRERVEGRHPAS